MIFSYLFDPILQFQDDGFMFVRRRNRETFMLRLETSEVTFSSHL